MSEITAITAAPKSAKAKKPASKAKKSANSNGSPRQLTKAQERIVLALASAKGGGLTKAGVAAKADVHPNWVAEHVGTDGEMASDRVSGKGPLKLVPAKLAKIDRLPADGDTQGEKFYVLTAAGRKLAAKLKAR